MKEGVIKPILVVILLVLMASCAGALVPFRLELSPQSLSVAPGQSQSATLTLIPEQAFGDSINLSLINAPGGVSGSFAVNPIPISPFGSSVSSSFSLSVGAGVPPGTYILTIKGSGTSQVPNDPRTAPTYLLPFTLTVTGNNTGGPDFSLPIAATPTVVLRGRSLTLSIPIQRKNDFVGEVALSLESNLDGITHSFNPPSTNGSSSQLTLNVAPTAAVGNRTLTVKGTATINNQTVTRTALLTITIVAGDG